ncbi:MAG TPA: ABC transporter ATP-binding protein [Gemmatimonadaceae bacterium]|nr:ABC transporter ATP-binding protein [Gemmatimonadaceae bacterium]
MTPREELQISRDFEFRCDHVSHVFDGRNGRVAAIEDISLTARVGEFVCIVGPSGCGKSTLLRIIAELLEPTGGTVVYGRKGEAGRHRTGLVFQDHGVFPWITVLDNVALGLELQGVERREREERARTFIRQAGLQDFESSYPHELSVGMRQRVGVARAFASDVQLLLMDEPFGSLDAQTKRVMQQDLIDLWQEARRTVVYVTHDVEEAIALGDRVIVLSPRPARIIEECHLERERTRDLRGRAGADKRELAAHIWDLLEHDVRPALLSSATA